MAKVRDAWHYAVLAAAEAVAGVSRVTEFPAAQGTVAFSNGGDDSHDNIFVDPESFPPFTGVGFVYFFLD